MDETLPDPNGDPDPGPAAPLRGRSGEGDPDTTPEERLEALEERVRLQDRILSGITEIVVAVDAEGRVTFVNGEASRSLGVDPEEDLGRPVRELYRYEYPSDVHEKEVMASLEDEGRWRGEVTLVPAGDRDRIPVEATIVDLEGAGGGGSGRVEVMRDVSRRKEAERKLFESRERLRVALQNIPLTAAVVDHEFRYRWVYNTAVRFPTRDVVGKRVDEVLRAEDAEKVMEVKKRVLEEREKVEAELEMELEGVRHVYHMVAEPYYDPDGELVGVMTAALDITDRNGLKEDLRHAKEAAEAANRSKSAFLASMSHELRTPLNAIVGYAELLDEGLPAPIPEGARQHVDRIRVSARHLLHLIEEILEYTRVEAAQERVELLQVEIAELIAEVRAIIEPLTSKKDLQLAIDLAEAPARLRTDPRKLRQILFNLLGNAAKYTEKGGVTLRVAARDGWVEFTVVDTGPGLSEENRERLFEPFWRGEDQGVGPAVASGGTGLGLPISLRYARLMGGDIRVESRRGQGSTFTLRLPD